MSPKSSASAKALRPGCPLCGVDPIDAPRTCIGCGLEICREHTRKDYRNLKDQAGRACPSCIESAVVYESSSMGPVRAVNKVGSAVTAAVKDITLHVERVAKRIDELPQDLKKDLLPEVMVQVKELVAEEHKRVPETVRLSVEGLEPTLQRTLDTTDRRLAARLTDVERLLVQLDTTVSRLQWAMLGAAVMAGAIVAAAIVFVGFFGPS